MILIGCQFFCHLSNRSESDPSDIIRHCHCSLDLQNMAEMGLNYYFISVLLTENKNGCVFFIRINPLYRQREQAAVMESSMLFSHGFYSSPEWTNQTLSIKGRFSFALRKGQIFSWLQSAPSQQDSTKSYTLALIITLLWTHRRRGGRVSPCQSPECWLL